MQARRLRGQCGQREDSEELADLASDQAKAMEELHGMHLDELEALSA